MKQTYAERLTFASPFRALSFGVGVLICESVAWRLFWMLGGPPGALDEALRWLVPFVAPFLVAYLSPRHKFLLGSSMVVFTALIVTGENLASEALGLPVDFPGLKGARILFFVSLAFSAVPSVLGSLAGSFLSTRHLRSGREMEKG